MKRIAYTDILSRENLDLIENTIFGEGVIIYPTDTLYGLGGNFFSPQVIEKIDRIKNRHDMPYSVVVHGPAMLKELVEPIPGVFEYLFPKLLPGKFTFMFNAAKSVDPVLLKGSSKIGIRIPNVPDLLKMVEILKVPLISTSVNRSGEPPLNDPEAIIKLFSNAVPADCPALLIDAGPLPASKGSTILDLTTTPITCLRRGDDDDNLKELSIPVVF